MKVKFLEGKTKSERNKIIAAALLGVLAIFALYFAFLRSPSSGATSVSVNVNAKGGRPASSPADPNKFVLPTAEEQETNDVTTLINYVPGRLGAPDPGRNIFAFYEPPLPTPYSPTPYIAPPPETPVPTPTPVYLVNGINPQSLYAGSRSFRLEIFGDRFTPEAKIYVSQTEFPTTFISPQQLAADVPAGMIATEGQRQIMVQSADGTKYSEQRMLTIQAPPKPQFQYVGAFLRRRGNNDTGVFREQGQNKPEFTARLNDVLGGRFRLINITTNETVFEDTSLGFKHRLPLVAAPAGSGGAGAFPQGQPGARGFPPSFIPGSDPNFVPYNPNIPQGEIPGIPNNIPRYIPPQPDNRNPMDQKDVDDEEPS